ALYVLLVKGCFRRVASSLWVRIRAGRPHSSRGRLSVTTSGAQGVCLAPRENRLSDRLSRVHATRAIGKGGDGSVGRRPHIAVGDADSIDVLSHDLPQCVDGKDYGRDRAGHVY